MKTLPPHLACYRTTPDFTERTVPKGLLSRHRTASGTFGLIRVLEGSLKYRILEPEVEEHLLDPDHPGVIEPGVAHEVEITGPVRFRVEFYR